MAYTTRSLKHPKPPEQERIVAAAEQAEIARAALLKMAHHLDDSATRHLHRDVLLVKDRVDGLRVALTDWFSE